MRIRASEAPAARAAHTKGRAFSVSTWARITRAGCATGRRSPAGSPAARLGSAIEITTMAKGRNGMPKAMSVNAHQGFVDPAAEIARTRPTNVPRITLPSAEMSRRAGPRARPQTNWLNTSMPWLVVPNQFCQLRRRERATRPVRSTQRRTDRTGRSAARTGNMTTWRAEKSEGAGGVADDDPQRCANAGPLRPPVRRLGNCVR